MPSTYVHLSGKDIDGTILRINGIKLDEENNKDSYPARKCQRCEKMNPPAGKFCLRCGAPLDLETAMKIEEKWKGVNGAMGTLLSDPEVLNLLTSKMKQMNISLDAHPSVK